MCREENPRCPWRPRCSKPSKLKQTKAIFLAVVERIKLRRRKPQKARKVKKLTQRVGVTTTKQKVKNIC